ncbi:MAG: acyl-CoA carboxylase subunit epsilon [Bifidobacteriaceae bacterium]|jgi:hypothetical protein|nr:acyl-CoA carboxylase subunit epsilon [Bifidobacteriaceae bacterium]
MTPPLLTITRGSATAEELAALTASLAVAASLSSAHVLSQRTMPCPPPALPSAGGWIGRAQGWRDAARWRRV